MTISFAAQKISEAAIIHFADKGFDASSLNTIAEHVGIRKATIYSHFKNKEELFSQAFKEAVDSEIAFVDKCFNGENLTGENYLVNVGERYQESARLRFLLRSAFIPPEDLRAEIQEGYECFLNRIKQRFIADLSPQLPLSGTLCANAYLGIIDSVHVELLYASPQAAETRRKALWFIFHTALKGA